MKKFEIIIFTALDRISRSTIHCLKTLNYLKEKNIKVVSLREQIDTSSPMGTMVTTLISSIAELERSLISERIKQALEVKKIIANKTGSGWRSGRPTVVTPEIKQEILRLRNAGSSIRNIGKTLGIGKTSVLRVLKTEKMSGPKT